MNNNRWIPSPEAILQDESLQDLVITVFHDIYQRGFAADPLINHRLPIEVRAIRDVEEWRVFLLLTPWMLSRVYLSCEPANIPLPPAWSAEHRADEPYLVIGPQVGFCLLQHEQLGHLNFHPQLGHYLLQPLILRMEQYASTSEVYRDWNTVIETRNENMRKRQAECRCQEEISRREFFTRLTTTQPPGVVV